MDVDPPPPENGERNALPDLRNFQFTFDCTDFIEPDVRFVRALPPPKKNPPMAKTKGHLLT